MQLAQVWWIFFGKVMTKQYTTVLFMILMLLSCEDAFEYSPNQVFDDDSATNVNAQNLDSLLAAPADDTITIAFVGDTQRFYDEIEDFIDTVNSIPSIDFVILAGDITDFGLLEEFEQVHERFSRINRPYFCVIGNHDVLAKGEETFQKMYGPLNFSFIYQKTKFIFHNTNGREYEAGKVPDMDWLRNEFAKDDPSVRHLITVSHIPPFSGDFDQTLEDEYVSLQRRNEVLLSLHGHIHEHKDGYFYQDKVRYITSPSFDLRSFVLLKITSEKVFDTLIEY
jgi:3',5'-cyclic AMP phosphodiesterase CpdA